MQPCMLLGRRNVALITTVRLICALRHLRLCRWKACNCSSDPLAEKEEEEEEDEFGKLRPTLITCANRGNNAICS